MFIPAFHITPHLLEIIEEIAVFREKILTATVQVPWVPLLQKDSKVRNAHSSTAIEGNPLTLEEVKALEGGKDISATSRAKKEILNYFAALRFIEKNGEIKTITHDHVKKLHTYIGGEVMDQGKAGTYRTIAVRVGTYLPPPATEVITLMSDLLKWWNDAASEWSPVISQAILHHQFETIHPFADGNGRTGRILALWELYRRGFDTQHIFSVDEIYWENRTRYYRALDAVRHQGGDLTSWLEFSAEALHLALERVWHRTQQFAVHQPAQPIFLQPKQEKLLELLRSRGGLPPKEIWESLKISKQGAMNLINPLLEAGIIKKIGTKKSGRYILV